MAFFSIYMFLLMRSLSAGGAGDCVAASRSQERRRRHKAHWTRDQHEYWMTSSSWAVCGCATGRNNASTHQSAPRGHWGR